MRGFTLISKACDLTVLRLLSLRKRSCKGFTLIELMVVIAIIAILVVIAIPSYGEYSNSQKLAEAANQLQIVLRQAQNNAQTGTQCKNGASISKANYWYIDLNSSEGSHDSYSFSANCEGTSPAPQVTILPSGVTISNLSIDGSCTPSDNYVRIRLNNISSSILFDDLGCPGSINSSLQITLTNSSSNKIVRIEKGGGIYVKD